jgi:hypothetical protein
MFVSQQNRPRSGVQWRMNGRAVVKTRKQTFTGPNVSPLANSCRAQVVQPGESVTRPDACRLVSMSLHAHEASIDFDLGDPQSEALYVDTWPGCAVLWRQAAVAGDLQGSAERLVSGRADHRSHEKPNADPTERQNAADHALRTALTR